MKKLTFEQKARMASEIFQAMAFLGIPASKYMELKNKYGGLTGLHDEMAKRLQANWIDN